MKLFEQEGKLEIGLNFWGSKHGIYMWRNWDKESICADLKQLADAGFTLLRVFPDWEYFQPISAIRGYANQPKGLTGDGGATFLPDRDETSGLNETAFATFAEFLDLAAERQIRIIPSILTGWMSGRMFTPPLLSNANLITDPAAIKQEVRFVRAFVRRFRHHAAIVAWCIGNECNCMEKVDSASSAWLWTSAMTDAIRAIDTTRPILSGMHSLLLPSEGAWTIQDQAEHCDILTTHPYGSPTYKSDIDPINTIRPLLHPVAQTLLYRNIGKKPCIIEETGTFGEMYADEDATAAYIRCSLYSAWAYDLRGYLWWIAFDQGELTYAPFATNNRASNYGVLRRDGAPKGRLAEFQAFDAFVKKFGQTLPARLTDGICLLPRYQKHWPAAYHAFVLAKQAGLELEFSFADDPLPEADLYLLPSLLSAESIRVDRLHELMERVANGATLYVSTGTGLLRNLGRDFGVHIQTRHGRLSDTTITLRDGSLLDIPVSAEYTLIPEQAEVLATDSTGNPVYVSASYGKGRVFWLTRAVEHTLFEKAGAYHTETAAPYYKLYQAFADRRNSQKLATLDSPMIGMTEHPLETGTHLLTLINYSPLPQTGRITLQAPAKRLSLFHGTGKLTTDATGGTVTIPPNQPIILQVDIQPRSY